MCYFSMKYKNVKKWMAENLLMGSILAVPVGICATQMIIDSKDAREEVAYTRFEPGNTIGEAVKYGWGIGHYLQGFDRDHNGVIDEIKHKWLSAVGKAQAIPCSHTYTTKDKEFLEL